MNKDALTAPEVAEILKIAQNTVYELVKRGELNCYKVGRKMRFTYDDVQEYIESSRGQGRKKETTQINSMGSQTPVGTKSMGNVEERVNSETLEFSLCGQDEILDVLVKYMNLQMPDLHGKRIGKGSYDSMIALYKDQVTVAACHMWDSETNSYNIPYITKMLPGCDLVVIHVAKRSQGFYVAEGNPKKITSWEDLKREEIVLANREPGAGTRILLDEHLRELGIDRRTIAGYGQAYLTHMLVAGAVSKGDADLGVGTEKTAANIRGVEFVPLQMEQYDLVVKKENFYQESVQLMLHILQTEEFREQFSYMNGYDVSNMGQVVFVEERRKVQ